MFIGEYTYNIDTKKRLTLPPKFRSVLGKKAIITKGLDGCLFLYTQKQWQELAEKLSKLPFSQADARGFTRVMLAGAMDVSIDSMGRILIPDYLKEYGRFDKKVVVAGLYSRIEIWDEDKWNGYKKRAESEVGDIAERLKDLEI